VIILSASDVPKERLQRFSESSMKLLDKEGLKESELLDCIESALKRIDPGKPGTNVGMQEGKA
jgi:hypothetical protein